MTEEPTRTPRRKARRRTAVLPAEKAAVIGAALAGMSGREISRQTGRHRDTISTILKSDEAARARDMAKSILAAASTDFARDWVRASKVAADKGNHAPALDALERLKAVEPVSKGRSTGPAFSVKIGICLPGLGDSATLGLPAGLPALETEAIEATETE
jgi:hypothetical protein